MYLKIERREVYIVLTFDIPFFVDLSFVRNIFFVNLNLHKEYLRHYANIQINK